MTQPNQIASFLSQLFGAGAGPALRANPNPFVSGVGAATSPRRGGRQTSAPTPAPSSSANRPNFFSAQPFGDVARGYSDEARRRRNDPLGGLFQYLMDQLTGGGVGVDEGNLMSQIRGQFDPVYDARRAAIENMMAQTEGRINRGRSDVESMYDQLGQNYEDTAVQARDASREYRREIENMYGALKTNVEGHYSKVSDEQEDLFRRLGIQEAAPEVMAPQGEQLAGALTNIDEHSTANQVRARDMGQVDQEYYRQGAPLARLTGSNVSTDLMRQLEDYMGQREHDILGLEAERTSGIQSAFTQLLSQAQGQAQQSQMANNQMLWQMLQHQMQQRAAANEPVELTADNFFQQLDPVTSMQVQQALRGIERQPEMLTNRQRVPGHPDPAFMVPQTPESWLEAVERQVEQGQIPPHIGQLLQQYIRMSRG